MEFIKRHLSRGFTFFFLLLVILQVVGVSFAPDSRAAVALAGAWYHPGRWITLATVPADIVFPEFGQTFTGRNQLAAKIVDQVDNPTRYISGFFSARDGFKAVADTLVGQAEFTGADLILVLSVRNGTAADAALGEAKTAVDHFIAAVDQYLQDCNARGIPATNMPANLNPQTTANLIALKGMIGSIINSIGKQKGDSEMALMVDITRGVYAAGSRIIVKSKLDMCARCETGLDSISTAHHAVRTDTIPYEVFVGASGVFAFDPHPNGAEGQGYMSTRKAPRHEADSFLFKTALAGTESDEKVDFPVPAPLPDADPQDEPVREAVMLIKHSYKICRSSSIILAPTYLL